MSDHDRLIVQSQTGASPLVQEPELQGSIPELVGNAFYQEAIRNGTVDDLERLTPGSNTEANDALRCDPAPRCEDRSEFELTLDALERGESLPAGELRQPLERIAPGESPTTDNAVIYGLGADQAPQGAQAPPVPSSGPVAPALVRPGIQLNARQDPQNMPLRNRSDVADSIEEHATQTMLQQQLGLMPDAQRRQITEARLAAAGFAPPEASNDTPAPTPTVRRRGEGCMSADQRFQWQTDLRETQYAWSEEAGDRRVALQSAGLGAAVVAGENPLSAASLSAHDEGVALGADMFDHHHRHEVGIIDGMPECTDLEPGEQGHLSPEQREIIVMETLRRGTR